MRIVLLGPAWPLRGGIAHHTACLFRALSPRHDVTLISARRQGLSWLLRRDDRDRSARALRAPAEAILDFWNPFTWRAAARRVGELRPDLAVVSWWSPFFSFPYAVAARRARPRPRTLVLCHNVLPHERTPLDRPLARAVLSGADAFLVAAEEERRRLLRLLPGARVAVAPHPTYGADLFPPGPSRDRARAALDLGAGPLLLFFGNVRRYKGLPVLLEALAMLPEVRLVVAGEFYGGRGAAERLVHRLDLGDRVTLLDRYLPNEEVGTWFAAADAAVFPYLHATGSGALTAAQGLGVPVIASAVGAFREAVRDGENGLLVPPGDTRALSGAIRRFFADDLGPGLRGRCAPVSWDSLARAVEAAGEPEREPARTAER